MRKEYMTPEFETIKFHLKDVILSSPTEAPIPEVIGGDNHGGSGSGSGDLLNDF